MKIGSNIFKDILELLCCKCNEKLTLLRKLASLIWSILIIYRVQKDVFMTYCGLFWRYSEDVSALISAIKGNL